jgi:hypothetical protein
MPRGGNRDNRETFVVDTLRLRNKGEVPQAPNKGAVDFYFRERVAYWMDEFGVEHPFGGFGMSASPGFTWGRKGNINSASAVAYLLNDDVPSNITGRIVLLQDAIIRQILITNGAASTFNVTVEEHDGVTYTSLITVSVVADRDTAAVVNVPVTTGKQLAVRISSGSANNPVVGLILNGTL